MTDAALLLDKPLGISSNRALQDVKKIYKVRKAGHAGTLDPLASGLLLVLFGEATKFAGPLLDADKEYVATVKLGEKTATGDAEGEIIERSAAFQVPEAAIAQALKKFEGSIEQVPPMYSALKRDGVPLYELARRGESVERAARPVRISLLEKIRFEAPLLELRVRCSKGTYIRTLAEDIAAALGTVGHLAALRRTASGVFQVSEAVGLEALQGMGEAQRQGRLLPLTALLAGLPRAELDAAAETRFRNGQALAFDGAQGLCGVYGRGGVVGLGRAEAGQLHPVRLTAAQGALAATQDAE
jgi:tRNA pseudouridine55 synthase